MNPAVRLILFGMLGALLVCSEAFAQKPAALYLADENGIHQIDVATKARETVIPLLLRDPGNIHIDPSTNKLYWADYIFREETGLIQRSNLDGSDIETIAVPGLGKPKDLVLDTEAGMMYWTSSEPQAIYRANLDGSFGEMIVSDLPGPPSEISIDYEAGKIYWTELNTSAIKRANLDGSEVETLVMYALGAPRYIFLDIDESLMYWVDESAFAIRRANLDGSEMTTLISTTGKPSGMAIDTQSGIIYWAELPSFGAPRKLRRANLDGSGIEDIIATTSSFFPENLTFDPQSNQLYWLDRFGRRIQRAPIDGSTVENVLIGVTSPFKFDIDTKNQKIYWADHGTNKIQRANMDGSNVEDLFEQQLLVESVQVDPDKEMVYWANWEIKKGKMDGTSSESLSSSVFHVLHMELDSESGTLYWIDQGVDLVQSYNLNGNSVQDLIAGYQAFDLALDTKDNTLYFAMYDKIQQYSFSTATFEDILIPEVPGNIRLFLDTYERKLYWLEQDAPQDSENVTILRSNLDGTNIEVFFKPEAFPFDMVLVPDTLTRASTEYEHPSSGSLTLSSPYPQPFHSSTSLTYSLPQAASMDVRVFDMLGREVDVIYTGTRPAGKYEVTWDASDLPSGMYMVRATSEWGEQVVRTVVKVD